MNRRHCFFAVLSLTAALLFSALPLNATEPFWSLEPSTREIERADSLTGFDITHYVINLRINEQTHVINGNVSAMVTAEEDLTSMEYELEGANLQVTSVSVNGIVSPFTHQNGIVHIPLNFSQGQHFTTTVVYGGVPSQSPAPYNIGMLFTPTAVYTLSNPDAGRYWWPSYDHPWDKALVDWYITVRSDWLVAANGLRDAIENNGDGTRTHHWICSSPVATYVMGFAAGPYTEFLQTSSITPIQNFVLPSQLNNAQVDFANLPEMLTFFSNTYGPYPFEKYGHAVVNMATYAAMEHQTMTTFGAAYLTGNQSYESIVAHELTHQWYGNYVTPITMREVWLKESFATYSEFLWEAHHHGWQAGCDYLRDEIQQYYISWENSNGPHTIFDPEYNMMFAPPTYEKSASVLHMLRLKIGNAAFFQFIRSILTAFPNSNINTAEFIDLAETASGQDLTQFFQQWIYSPGIPNANLTIMQDGLGTAKVIGTTSSPTATLFDLEIPLRIPGSAVADSVVVHATPQGYANYFIIGMDDDIAGIQIDPDHWVLTRQLTKNTLQLASCLAYDGAVDLSWFAFDADLPLSGYQVYRREMPAGQWFCITPIPVSGLAYTDDSVTNGHTYQYYVVAVDTEGFFSLPSNALEATPIDFPFDQGFLVVDETRNGTGTSISPTDAMVDDFYSYVLQDFNHSVWDLDTQGTLALSDLSHHPLVLWHCDDFTDMQMINNLNMLGSYVLSGGKLLISGWKYPSQFDAAFLNKFLPGITPVLNNSAVLVSAQSDIYPDLHPDPNKLVAPWNGMLPYTYVFPGAADVLYSAEIVNGGTNDGEPIAITSEYSGTLALLGFPLYFMLQDEVRAFLSQYLPVLYPGVANQDGVLPPAALSVSSSPNPFSSCTNIIIRSGITPAPATVSIYNLRGQKVQSIKVSGTLKGESQIAWDGRDEKGDQVAAGIYIIEVHTGRISRSAKVLLLR